MTVTIQLVDFKNFSSSPSIPEFHLIGMLTLKFQNQSKGFCKWQQAREEFIHEIIKQERRYLYSLQVGFSYVDPVYLDLPLEFIHDWEIIEKLMDYVPSLFFPIEIATREFWMKMYSNRNSRFSPEFKPDRELIITAVRAGNTEVFGALTSEMADDVEFWRECIKIDGENLAFCLNSSILEELLQECAKNRSFEILKTEMGQVVDFGEKFNDDKEIVLENVKRNGGVFVKASKRLQQDKDVIVEAMKTCRSIFSSLSEDLKKDWEIVNQAIRYKQFACLKYYFENKGYVQDYDKDLDLICSVLSCNSSEYVSIPLHYKNDRELHLRIVKIHSNFFSQFPKQFTMDEEIVIEAVKTSANGFNLFSSAPNSLKNDEEFVRKIIELAPSSIIMASNKLKKNRELVMEAVKREGALLQFLESFRKDKEVLTVALKQMTRNRLSQEEFNFLLEESLEYNRQLIPIHSRELVEIVAKFSPYTLDPISLSRMSPVDGLELIISKYNGTIPKEGSKEYIIMLLEARLDYEYCGFSIPSQYRTYFY